ncbi:hypothetical protein VMCG_04239 [Cytospora schulzeri]|uniref:Uncharacterized protein n=1 Tax=Cytospora schulzeri TaxID=448051 RepID=A0A423WT29_9PEZI|nr:hypothetical protein VMCG_04239 [Valsa malicola]
MAFSDGACDMGNTSSAWYDSVNPLRVDLVGDLAGRELFVIHGDALMLYCITKAKADLQDGFQFLHAIHAVENLLYKLKERGCYFHILDRSQSICFEFQSMNDPDFDQYLTLNAIRFFLCLDGPAFNACNKTSATSFLSIAHHLAARGYRLAFINGIEFASSGVRSSVISPTVSRQLVTIVLPERLPLTQLSFDLVQTSDEVSAATFLSEFSSACLGLLAGFPQDFKWDLEWGLFDLLDGRLLRYLLEKHPRLPKSLVEEVHGFAAKMTQVTGIDLSDHLPCFDLTSTTTCLNQHNRGQVAPRDNKLTPGYGVLPFSN